MSEIKPLTTFSLKVEEDYVKQFKQLQEAAGVATANMMFQELIDRYVEPLRVNDCTEALQQELALTKAQLDTSTSQLGDAAKRIAELEQQLLDLQQAANENARVAEAQMLAHEKQMSERVKLTEGQVVVDFVGDNLKVLDYVCARESRRRKQQWTRSHVINYFINARFVRGLLNGDLGSVSDGELRKLGVSLHAPHAIEI